MNKLKLNKQTKLIFSACLVGVLLLVAVYFLIISPISNEAEAKERELQALESELALVQAGQNDETEGPYISSVELQKKIPVKANVQQLLLDLNQAETVSDSLITSVSVEEALETGQAYTPSEEEGVEEDAEASSTTVTVPSVDGLEKVRLSLSVQSESYPDLEKFLASLESLERIMTVENISFQGVEEITSVDQTNPILEYTVVVSAYYAPGLEDLLEDLPRVRSAVPANKTNPFYQSPILQRMGEEDQQQ